MRHGVTVPNVGSVEMLLELGRAAEVSGWDGFFLWDHIRFRAGAPVPVFDPWVTLGALAALTERIVLGPLVTPVARRRPWKLARETVTLDHLSAGRSVLGVGLGFPPDVEFGAFGEPEDDRTRAGRLDEGLAVLDGLWSGEALTFDGEHLHVHDVAFAPRPRRGARVPVWVAGMWPNRAPFVRAARWDGVFPIAVEAGMPVPIGPEGLAEVVGFVTAERGSLDGYDVVVQGAPDTDAADYRAAGATWWLLSCDAEPGWEDAMIEDVRAGPPVG